MLRLTQCFPRFDDRPWSGSAHTIFPKTGKLTKDITGLSPSISVAELLNMGLPCVKFSIPSNDFINQ